MKTKQDFLKGISGKNYGWLDDDGYFKRGKHKARNVDVVCKEEPTYLVWLIQEVDTVTKEDVLVMETSLKFYHGDKYL